MGIPPHARFKRGPLLVSIFVVVLLYFLFYSSSISSSSSAHPSAAASKQAGKAAAALDLTRPEDTIELHSRISRSLERYFPYDPTVQKTYPRTVWQTWKVGRNSDQFPTVFRRRADSWLEKNPGYAVELLDDNGAANFIRQVYGAVPEVIEAYFAMPVPVLRADFLRYLFLLSRGGVYSDIDTVDLKPIDLWLPYIVTEPTETTNSHSTIEMSDNDAVQLRAQIESQTGLAVGIEADPDRPDWHDWYARRLQFCQWTIMAKKGHPVLVDIVANITAETLHRRATDKLPLPKAKNAGSMIMDWTGPGIWTDTVFKYLNRAIPGTDWHSITGISKGKIIGDIIIMPITAFSPAVGTMGAHDVGHPHAFSHHTFEGSWKPENERRINPS
ncbi:nucleotide-diphospho-sugar transferase [Lipomyces oligophaga]|uniref:nucleotide-diphospho-sugar transferase n=1 Tax=Lipomyces oligophaga TaxID=45792 RepID=UPI0034CEE185